jgi:hypothetical protein
VIPEPAKRTTLKAGVGALTAALTLSGSAAAQTSATPTETPTPTEAPEQTRVQVGPALTVADYEFSDGEFRIDFRADAFRRITVTDVGAMVSSLRGGDGARAVEIAYRQMQLSRGENRVKIGVETVDDEAMVTVATSETLVLLRSGALKSRDDVPWGTAQALVTGTALGTGGLVYRRMKNDEEEPEEVDRIA